MKGQATPPPITHPLQLALRVHLCSVRRSDFLLAQEPFRSNCLWQVNGFKFLEVQRLEHSAFLIPRGGNIKARH